jgi:RNA polymerase sigma factor (sigma-70 family)
VTPRVSSALLRTQADERLALLAGSGNERAFEEIVERYRTPLQRYCERALPRAQAWVALQNGTEVRHLKPWLYRITQTTALETAQTPGYDYEELEQSLRPDSAEESEPEQRAVIRRTLAGLAALPEAQREALLRAAVHGQSRAEIAEALGVTEGAVRQLLHRARSSLRSAATALTPLPLLNWATTLGPADPAAARTVGAGVAGTAGLTGFAKASTVVASAGVLVAAPAAVHHARHAPPAKDHAKARASRPAKSHGVSAAQPAVFRRAGPVSRPAPREEQEQEGATGDGAHAEAAESRTVQRATSDDGERETMDRATRPAQGGERAAGSQGAAEHAEHDTDQEAQQSGDGGRSSSDEDE